MSVRPPAPPRTVQRERVDNRAAARLQVEIVEAAQHRLAVRPHRRGVRLPASPASTARYPGTAPVRAGRLARHQHPPAEVTGLGPRRPCPRDLNSPQEPEPPQKIMAIRAQRRLRPARGLQITQEPRDRRHGLTSSIDDLVRLPPITTLPKRPHQRNRQHRQIPDRTLISDHYQRP